MEEYNTRIANGDIHVTLQSLLNEYERARWLPCFEIFWKAAFLGYLETGGINGFYSKFRDAFFKSMGIIGVASKVLLNAATPKVWPNKIKKYCNDNEYILTTAKENNFCSYWSI